MPKKPQAATPPDPVIALAALHCLVEGVDLAAIGAYLLHPTNQPTLDAIVGLLKDVTRALTHLPGPKGAKKLNGDSCPPPFTLCNGAYCTMTGCPPDDDGHGKEHDD
jgi:hypothetical protein